METIEFITKLINLEKAKSNCLTVGERNFSIVSFYQKMTILRMYSVLASITLDLTNCILTEKEMEKNCRKYSHLMSEDAWIIFLYFEPDWGTEILVGMGKNGGTLNYQGDLGRKDEFSIGTEVIVPTIALGKLIS